MKILLITLILGSLIWAAPSFSGTGYKRSAWGSKTWTGPGTPPHWSPQKPSPNHPVDPEWGVKPPVHRPGRRSRVYYYQKPVYETEVIVIEQKTQVPEYIPSEKRLSPLRCSGETVTTKDPITGELVIEYTTSSRQCPE